ncbi:MAG: hypothetical protein ACREOE_06190, partial [Gemmatimonadales bacterium]
MAAACSSAPAPSPTGAPATGVPPTNQPTQAAVQLLLRVTSEGGFIAPSANLASVPIVSVYADGRILTPGPVDTIYPGPLLPPVAVKDVGPAGAQAIVAALRAAGLDKTGAGGGVGNPDAATTVFAVSLDGSTITTRFHLGGGGPGGPGGPGAASPDPGVAAAGDLLNRLIDPSEAWGATSPITTTLTPTAYLVFVAPGAPVGDLPTSEPFIPWPLATPLDQFGAPATPDRGITGLRQGAVFGADAATLAPVLAAANALTAFSSGGNLYTLYV